jgi:phosphate transport system permease protein
MTQDSKASEPNAARFDRRKNVLFGKDKDSIIKGFFGSSATVAIVVLGLITIFLFKEGAGFLGSYHKSLQEYRLSGLEYVDILKETRDDFSALNRYLNDVRAKWIQNLKAEGLPKKELAAIVTAPEAKAFFLHYIRAGSQLRGFIKQKMDASIEVRDRYITNENLRETVGNYTAEIETIRHADYRPGEEERLRHAQRLKQYMRENSLAETELQEVQRVVADLESGAAFDARARVLMLDLLQQQAEATRQMIQPVDFNESIAVITADQEAYAAILTKLKADIYTVLDRADAIEFNDPDLDKRIERFRELNEQYLASLPEHRAKLAAWNQNEAIPIWRALVAFLAGKDWVTASDQQDWYGLLPLLGGSLLISIIALFFAVPFGVGAAIYVNQIAGPVERNLIKPYVEFVSAIPSVVIGFFGVVVFGEAIRQLSQFEFMAWVPFFPLQERLNAFTAGGLLALMAIPTIFTLAEDAINNIPRHFKEASFAVGATRLQTTLRVIVPSALSGIISAVMLGFGRVIGETMVVLLCAGNRIKIPDFSDGLGVFFQPVHTMTGIIAQEMGEVVRGSVHYRALFMVGIVLFFVSLLINYGAQWVVKKYRKVGD